MEASDAQTRLAAALTPRLTHYVPHVPTPKQHAGLLLPQREVLYGGAAGGGKSDWLLMGALQYADVPGYGALLLRRTFKELELEGGLLERAWDWLANADGAVPHDGGMKWTFGDDDPDSEKASVLQFGYLDGPNDHLRYQGSNWQFVGFDELTHFREKQYRYLFSRLRRPDLTEETPDWKRAVIENLSNVPLRMRAASNPGGPGHEWVKNRFGIYLPEGDPDPRRLCHRPEFVKSRDRVFLPASLPDNPHLDQTEYERSLDELDSTTRQQLLHGDWDAVEPGELFREEFFEVVDVVPDLSDIRWVRYWDMAATEPSEKNPDPDWTVGLKMGRHPNGTYYVVDVRRMRKRPEGVEAAGQQAAEDDGIKTAQWLEQEPGASGKQVVAHWQRTVLPQYEVRALAPSDSKGVRARPVASKAEQGMVKVLRAAWNRVFFDELEAFAPNSEEESEVHDDQVDALSGAFTALQMAGGVTKERARPAGKEPIVQEGDLTLRGEHYIDQK